MNFIEKLPDDREKEVRKIARDYAAIIRGSFYSTDNVNRSYYVRNAVHKQIKHDLARNYSDGIYSTLDIERICLTYNYQVIGQYCIDPTSIVPS